ncbi:IclR family transcriptional regulator [Microvirga sp. BT689]|uniref:IclR family transcriptional regulator n=1 Tax=Microvirga arvi TaxID=2778731 RepID=UPI00195132A5|nr:IclR family transcriptional regulator [Microvirga arvi]MBM6583248.1 IclR family transcriptional regulator [Microvirga arvi]
MDKSVTKMFALIEALAGSEQPRGVTELARELALTKTNVHRLLRTLEANGFARRVGELGRYELTLKLWELSSQVVARLDVKKESAGFLARLSEMTQETVHLSVRDGFDVVYIDKIESAEPVRAFTKVGSRAPLYCVGTGKAMLAFLPPEQIASLEGRLERYTDTTITDFGALQEELAQVRSQGFAVYRAEWRDGVNSIAAPIRDHSGSVIAAVGIAGPATRLQPNAFPRLAPLVVDTAAAISRRLGYRPTGDATGSNIDQPGGLSIEDHSQHRSAQGHA